MSENLEQITEKEKKLVKALQEVVDLYEDIFDLQPKLSEILSLRRIIQKKIESYPSEDFGTTYLAIEAHYLLLQEYYGISHSALPIGMKLSGDVFREYFKRLREKTFFP